MGLHDDPPLDRPLTQDDLGDGTAGRPQLTIEVWLPLRGSAPPRLLMMQRCDERGGFWQGVSGRVEPTDRTLRDAAIREVREETGLVVAASAVVDLGQGYAFLGVMSHRPFRKRSVAVWLPEDFSADDVELSEEHVEAVVLDFDDARARIRFDEMQAELDALRAL